MHFADLWSALPLSPLSIGRITEKPYTQLDQPSSRLVSQCAIPFHFTYFGHFKSCFYLNQYGLIEDERKYLDWVS